MLGSVPAVISCIRSLAWRCALFVPVAGGCVHPYEAPRPDQPHAVLKFRRVYERTAGASLRETLTIDEQLGYAETVPREIAEVPRNDAILVHPVPATFAATSIFSHTEMRSVLETYYAQESYQETESYDCGSGAFHHSCTRTVTRYRTVPRQHWVMRMVEVPDASCARQLRIAPSKDGVYLMQLTFQDHMACSLACYQQRPTPAGGFQNSPCAIVPEAP